MADFPFADPPNLAVFTMWPILRGQSAVLAVFHDRQGDWQFLDGSESPDPDDAAVVALEEMVKLDPTLAELADLPRGWCAVRDEAGGEWEYGQLPPGDDDPEEEDSQVVRHEARTKPFEPVFGGDDESMDAICKHFEEHIGEAESVLHEIISDIVHIDVHQIPPSEDRPYWTLFTTGMSDRPMTVPEGAEDFQYAELMIKLPQDWPMERLGQLNDEQADESEVERFYWPIRWLKILARLPHEYDTWLHYGHTVPNGDPAEPVADNTGFCCMLVTPPLEEEPFGQVHVRDDKVVHIFNVLPIYPPEMQLKLAEGADALLEALEEAEISDIVDIERPSAVE